MRTNFALLIFGENMDVHTQACFALLSTMARTDSDCNWVVVTDAPDFYRWFGDSIRIIHCSEEQLAEWRGKHDFFWRVKIQAIRTVAEKMEGHIVYMDADIVCREDLSKLIDSLNAGHFYMHKHEYLLRTTRSNTGHRMWRVGKGQTYAGYVMDGNSSMWNAGIIGIPFDERAKLDDVLVLCDAMSETTMPSKLLEQYSFSRVLEDTGRLMMADHWFAHYWGNKEGWLVEINRVLVKILLMNIPLQEALEIVRQHHIDLPVYVREPWAERTWKKIKRHVISPKKAK